KTAIRIAALCPHVVAVWPDTHLRVVREDFLATFIERRKRIKKPTACYRIWSFRDGNTLIIFRDGELANKPSIRRMVITNNRISTVERFTWTPKSEPQ